MPDYMRDLGRPFVASALRRVADALQTGASEWYGEFGIAAPVRTASALLLLKDYGDQSVTGLAGALNQSHPTIIAWVRELEQRKLVSSRSCPKDGRRTLVHLTRQGRRQAERIASAQTLFASAYAKMAEEAGADIFDGLLALEAAVRRKPMVERLRDEAAIGEQTGKERSAA